MHKNTSRSNKQVQQVRQRQDLYTNVNKYLNTINEYKSKQDAELDQGMTQSKE